MTDDTDRILTVLARLEAAMALTCTRDDLAKMGAELIKVRTDVMDRLDRLQDVVTAMPSDVLVNYASGERIERRISNSDEQARLLVEQVNLMFKRILGIDERVRALEEKR